MEMEYINENTIRVFIDTDDLIERGISFMDIMSNQNEVEHFFMSILEEVDVSQKFQHTEAITFQVMPKEMVSICISVKVLAMTMKKIVLSNN